MTQKFIDQLKKLRVINWDTISLFGKNNTINRSYIYLFLIPVLAKFLSKVQPELKLQFGDYSFEFVAELPFTWRLLFTAAILFTTASLLYKIFAPLVIKENRSFGEFSREKRNFTQIVDYMEDLGIDKCKLKTKYNISLPGVPGETRFYQAIKEAKKQLGRKKCKRPDDTMETLSNVISCIYSTNKHKRDSDQYNEMYIIENLVNAYTSVRSFALYNNPLILVFSFLLYFSGILCLGYVIFENATEVYK